MNFQAAVTAITYIHMTRGRPLLWLDKLVDDVPTTVQAETGGAGDDLRLLLKDIQSVEVQIKKGLRSGTDLWGALIKLANAVTTGAADFGVLIVSPTSSNTITEDLATDIVRIGDGRTDDLSDIATKLLDKLNTLSICPRDACARIRIQTVPAMAANQASILAARAELAHLCADDAQVGAAWNALYADASFLIEHRGQRDVSSLLRALMSEGVTLAQSNTTAPALLLAKLARWTLDTHATFSIFGVGTPLKTDESWISLTAVVREEVGVEASSLAEMIQHYQAWESRSISRDAHSVDPETLGRFVTRSILVAGPGMGKTTLLKRIARRYSEDAIPVLRVRLSAVAARMRAGVSFEESVFYHGLDGSQISLADAARAKLPNWLLLCDGLDECGSLQEDVAAGVDRFAAGHPNCRIVVTTRPVGYRAAHFSDWRHYDLPALDTSAAHAHAARLVEAIAPPGSDLHRNARDVCQRELDNNAAAKVVGRTPLLLSLAAVIIARGKTLGATRERLFEQIFELIDEVPNTRVPEKPAPAVLLRRFLDILGWEMICHPLSSIDKIVERCADHLAHETGAKPLAAIGDAERYLGYWQDVGMIECVGHDDQQTLAFIQKSFGEFAAARRLRSLPREAQAAAVADVVGVPAWAEVLRFAGKIGLADLISDHLLTGSATNADTTKRISGAVELIAEASVPPDPTRRSRILEESFRVAASDRRSLALEVGQPLVAAARRFPDEVGPAAAAHIGSEHAWTRLIAWGCLVAAGPKHYSPDGLVAVLRSSADAAGPGLHPSLSGGAVLARGDGRELAEEFILDACATIIDRAPTEVADNIVPEVLNHPNFGSVGFLSRAHKLLQNKRKNYRIGSLEWSGRSLFDVPDGYFEARRATYEAIFDALDLPPSASHDDGPCPRPLLHLSAFIEASQMDEVPASDVWAWSRPFERAATYATLQAFIAVSGIDLEMLRQDAVHARRYLDSENRAKDLFLFDVTVPVDPPPIDWSRVRALGLDAAMIEVAVSHPSQWIKWLAANLLANILEPDELERAVRRLFETGTGLTLWAACGLAPELERQRALPLVLERLAKPLVRGCGHLFDLLRNGPRPQADQLFASIRAGLLTADADTALAAAKLAAEVASPGLDGFVPILNEACAHWLVHEEPYPTDGGVVPNSPRAKLVEALVKIRLPSYEEVKSFLQDSRYDVREIGTEVLLQRLRLPAGERLQFFREVEAGDLPAHLLGKALNDSLPVSEDEIATVERLLTSPCARIRYGAMELLTQRYVHPDRISIHARVMTHDSEQQIKERAFTILDGLQPHTRSAFPATES